MYKASLFVFICLRPFRPIIPQQGATECYYEPNTCWGSTCWGRRTPPQRIPQSPHWTRKRTRGPLPSASSTWPFVLRFWNGGQLRGLVWNQEFYPIISEDTFGHNLESQSKEQLNAITTYTWQVLTRVWQGNQSHCLSCPPRTPLTVRTRSPPRTPPVHCPWASVSSFWNVLLMSLQGTKKVLFLIIGKKSINIHSESISAWSKSFSLSGKILKYTFHFAAQLSRSGLQVTHNEEQINAIINLHVQVSTRYGSNTVNEVWGDMAP